MEQLGLLKEMTCGDITITLERCGDMFYVCHWEDNECLCGESFDLESEAMIAYNTSTLILRTFRG